MERRTLLAYLGALTAAAATGAYLGWPQGTGAPYEPASHDLTTEEREALLREMISTPEGRKRLAEAMTQPKRCGGRDYPPCPAETP